MDRLTIHACYDGEARVWVATNDALGVATEAESLDVLEYKLREMLPELVELNGIDCPRPIEFTLVSEKASVAFA